MIRHARPAIAMIVLASSAACSSSSSPSTQTTSDACTDPGPLTVTVDPTSADVLTCKTRQITATVAGTCGSKAVSWAVTGGGSVDVNGLYTAPITVPTPPQASVVATSQADGTKSATSTLTLHTALPKAATSPGVAADDTIFHHQIAASGKRVYAVLAAVDKSGSAYTYSLNVVASDDGGSTWGAPAKVSDVPNNQVAIQAPSIAVDAGDPNTVYVSYTLDEGAVVNTSDAALPQSGSTLALGVSTDGGKSFKNYVLESHVSGFEQYADVASPAAGTVLVEAPYIENGHIFRTYLDANKGAGFAHATGYLTSEYTDVNSVLAGTAFNDVKSNGGTEGFESPRLVTDGKKNVCIVFSGGYLASTEGDGKVRVAVQCSQDSGGSFGAPVDLDYDTPDAELHHPIAAFGPSGQLAVAYWSMSADGSASAIHLAIAKSGTTFAAPVKLSTYQLPASLSLPSLPMFPALAWEGSTLWLSYLVADGADPYRVVVDKSCDGGTTWSGAQLLNGPEPTIVDDYTWPALVIADSVPALFSRKGAMPDSNLPFQFVRLEP